MDQIRERDLIKIYRLRSYRLAAHWSGDRKSAFSSGNSFLVQTKGRQEATEENTQRRRATEVVAVAGSESGGSRRPRGASSIRVNTFTLADQFDMFHHVMRRTVRYRQVASGRRREK